MGRILASARIFGPGLLKLQARYSLPHLNFTIYLVFAAFVHWSAACGYSLSKTLGKHQQSVLNFQLFCIEKEKLIGNLF